MPVLNSILECIGNTPLVRLDRARGALDLILLGKLEMMNPGGSVKDRIGLAMVQAAIISGALKPGDTIVEATAGNTGVGLAMAAALYSCKCVFLMPEKMSRDKEDLLRAYGAEVIRTPNVPPEDPQHFQAVARRLSIENGWFLPDQFGNPANPEIHYKTTGPEIWADSEGAVDVLVCGVGTGGTLTGAGRFLKEQKPSVQIVLADPVGSALGGGDPGKYLLEGIGGSKAPDNLDVSLIDTAIKVSDHDAFLMARRLAMEEGMLVGGAAGCAVVAALEYGRSEAGMGKTIVAILPDTGRNYLSKIFNEEWMRTEFMVEG